MAKASEGMGFGEALKLMRAGKKVTRENDFWLSKGLYLEMDEIKEDNDIVIRICNNSGTRSYYTPVQADVLACDWMSS